MLALPQLLSGQSNRLRVRQRKPIVSLPQMNMWHLILGLLISHANTTTNSARMAFFGLLSACDDGGMAEDTLTCVLEQVLQHGD